jgi:hypothetical protein
MEKRERFDIGTSNVLLRTWTKVLVQLMAVNVKFDDHINEALADQGSIPGDASQLEDLYSHMMDNYQ